MSPPSAVREPAVAGSFYPDDPLELRRRVASLMPARPRARALAVVVPHAGFVYSGKVAGGTYARVEMPRDVVLLCFHHRGRGAETAVWAGGAWRTPLGDCPVNADLARAVLAAFPEAEADEEGHLGEHSGEVQIPFLQVARADVRVVPVALSSELRSPRLESFGRALAGLAGEFLVVASTDLNHYEDVETTRRRDEPVIRALEGLDAEGVRRAVEGGTSMCGYAPAIAACAYARARGARRAGLVMHATSADAGGDADRVVGYAGLIVSEN